MSNFRNAAKLMMDGLPKLKIRLDQLTGKSSLVGVPQDHTERKAEDEESGMNNASLAYIHDNGSPANNIPAREFMRPGVEAVAERISKTLKSAAQKTLKGDAEAAEAGLNKVGLIAQNSIKSFINSGVGPSLSESTLAARRRKGFKGTKQLIRTGQFRNSITYVIRKS